MDQNETPPPHDGMLRLENLSRNPSPLPPLQTTVTANTPSPASSRPPLRRSTTVDLEWNPAYRPLGGPEYLKILAKYNLFNEDERHGRVVCRFVNAGNLRDRQPQVIKVEEFSAQGNQEFLAHISIGNPPQTLRVDLDTGSSDFWVFSTLLTHKVVEQASQRHTIFDPKKSHSWHWPHHPFWRPRKDLEWDIEYGDGSSASGIVGFDDVTLGSIKITKQAVQLAKYFSGKQFRDGSADGILGLAFGHLNSVTHDGISEPVATPLENMVKQNLLPEMLFTVFLGSECFFTFGFVDEETKRKREIHWVEVDSRGGFWNFSSKYARVGNKLFKRGGGCAIADTGSSIILTHPHIVWMIYKQIKGAKYDNKQPGWVYPMDSEVPEVSFSVGDDDSCMITISPEHMHHSDVGGGFYFGSIQENPAYDSGGLQFDIFGTPFLRQVYAIFDLKGTRFGVIKNVDEEVPMLRELIVESPTTMSSAGTVGEEDEIEDSVDGSITEAFPRRTGTMDSEIVNLTIPEEGNEGDTTVVAESSHVDSGTALGEPVSV